MVNNFGLIENFPGFNDRTHQTNERSILHLSMARDHYTPGFFLHEPKFPIKFNRQTLCFCDFFGSAQIGVGYILFCEIYVP